MAEAESSGRTLVCSVLFLDIVGYSKQAVADQQRLKQLFNNTLAKALEGIPQRDRIILDTGDGAAITFFGDPEHVMHIAIGIKDALEMPVCMGINLGPVRLVTDLNGHVNVIGDGINVAQRVMSFAQPGQLLVSRSFYEIVVSLSAGNPGMFTHIGARKDKHVREHEVYAVGQIKPQQKQEAAAAPADAASNLPAETFDAGEHLIVSAFSKTVLEAELGRLQKLGARIISEPTPFGKKWVASCNRPDIPTLSRVEQLGNMRIVTGPTREVVAAKVAKLLQDGAAVVSDAESINGVWTAVCELRAH